MKRQLKKLFIKVQYMALWCFIVRNFWAPIHSLLYRKIFHRSYVVDKEVLPFLTLEPSVASSKLAAKILKYTAESNILLQFKKEMALSNSNQSFVKDIYGSLPINLRAEAYRIAIGDSEARNYVKSYFSFMPRIHDINILYNIPNDLLKEEGSKLWHRDAGDTDFKNTKLFIPITDISDKNGPFFYFKSKLLFAHHNVLTPKESTQEAWIASRIDNDTISSIEGEVFSIDGACSGTRLLIDTVNTYHKGGFCKENDRLMLQISFHGNGYSATAPQDFSKEIHYLRNNYPDENLDVLDLEVENRNLFLTQSKVKLFISKVIFKAGASFFVARRK